jgi:hypothetical protein
MPHGCGTCSSSSNSSKAFQKEILAHNSNSLTADAYASAEHASNCVTVRGRAGAARMSAAYAVQLQSSGAKVAYQLQGVSAQGEHVLRVVKCVREMDSNVALQSMWCPQN